jgi:pyruvate/2-oxoglutarate dehydrogenase complex dihydrolipoamide dehydrogenase (E3) component
VLQGKVSVGRKVAIIGGSSTGVETAEFILQQGDHEVVVIEQLPHILSDISHDAELALLDKLIDKNFRSLEDTRVVGIEAQDGKLNLNVRRFSLDHRLTGFDTVILAVGVKPDNRLGLELREKRQNVYLVGDCEGAGDYRKAVHDAAGIAIQI